MQNYCFNRIVAACLLAIYVFDLAGYPMVLRLMINQSNRQTANMIQKGSYNEDDLVHIKIPVLLPYSTNWSEYETYEGEVEFEGIYYKFVKRKVANDTLHLLCLPDFKLTRLQITKDRYAGQLNDSHPSSNEKSTRVSGKIAPFSEYEQPRTLCVLIPPAIADISFSDTPTPFLPKIDQDCIVQPPDQWI